MLLRFEVRNHRSIREPVELSMIAVDDRSATRGFERLKDRVLTVAAIYGANASGKSNILESLTWLAEAVRHSLRQWDESIPRDPHAFQGAAAEPSIFKLELMVNEVRYSYTLAVSDKEVLAETLHSYPQGRARKIFDRQSLESITFRSGLAHGAVRELLTPTTLVLSAGVRLRTEGIAEVGRAIANMQQLGFSGRGQRRPRFWSGFYPGSTTRIFSREDEESPDEVSHLTEDPLRAAALGLLRFADLGIEDVEVPAPPSTSDPDSPRELAARPDLKLIHNVGGEEVALNFGEESQGTRTWYRLIAPLLEVLKDGRILLVDKMDASLHPRLTAKIIELFYDEQTNPNNAQLIFTTHDTHLLLRLNRDEIWLAEKDNRGATSLTALADFSGDAVRRSMNLERNYLQGRYGGVPQLDESHLAPTQKLVAHHD
jgi:uncharacterized protein